MRKTLKKFLSIMLAVVMLFSTAAVGGTFSLKASAANALKAGDIIEFGSYPQSWDMDSETWTVLNAPTFLESHDWDTEWTSYGYYQGNVQGDWMKYLDLYCNGNKYRGVYGINGRPRYTYEEESLNNPYYTYGNLYWYKFEPLKWRVLDPDTGLIVCETCIDAQPFNNTVYQVGTEYYSDAEGQNLASDYATSSIRAWLNNNFLNTAFTPAEQHNIYGTMLDNNPNTVDRVFIQSYDEAKYYFPDSNNVGQIDFAKYATQCTKYSNAQNCKLANVVDDPDAVIARYYDFRPSSNNVVYRMDYNKGTVSSVSDYKLSYTYVGTRPAMCVDLAAIIGPEEYTIEYTLGGGTVAKANRTIYTEETETFTLENPIRTGYEFKGWTGTGLGAVSKTVTVEQGSTGDRSYTAKWEAIPYGINYDLDSGTVDEANPETYTVESSAFTLNNPTKTGYTFTGWSGTDIEGTAMDVTIEQGSTGNREYTATWAENSYTVNFNANGGTGTMAKQGFVYGAEQPLAPNGFKNDSGIYFVGWSTSPDGDVVYKDKESVINLTAESSGEVTLYAVWEELNIEISFGTSSEGCELFVSEPTEYGYPIIRITAPFVRENADGKDEYFLYWKDANGNLVSTYEDYQFYGVANIVLTPVYYSAEDWFTNRQSVLYATRVVALNRSFYNEGEFDLFTEHSVSPVEPDITAHGVIYTENPDCINQLVLDSNNEFIYKKTSPISNNYRTGTSCVKLQKGISDIVWARGYVVDKDGVIHYGPVQEFNYNSPTYNLLEDERFQTLSFACFDLIEQNVVEQEPVIEEPDAEEPAVEEPTETPANSFFAVLETIWSLILTLINTIFKF